MNMDWNTKMMFMRKNQSNGLGPFSEKMLNRLNALQSYCQVAADYAITGLQSNEIMPTVRESVLSCFDNLIEQAQEMRSIVAAVPIRDLTPRAPEPPPVDEGTALLRTIAAELQKMNERAL